MAHLVDLGDVPRAVVLTVVAADALVFVDDDGAVFIAVDRILRATLCAGGIAAVEAVLLEKVPVELSLMIDALFHLNERVDA